MGRPYRTLAATLIVAAACSEPDQIVEDPGGPGIISFTAKPERIRVGQAAILSWKTRGTNAVDIEPNVGLQPPSGDFEVKPLATTAYTLTLLGGAGNLTSRTTVEVIGGPPRVDAFTATPRTIMAANR